MNYWTEREQMTGFRVLKDRKTKLKKNIYENNCAFATQRHGVQCSIIPMLHWRQERQDV